MAATIIFFFLGPILQGFDTTAGTVDLGSLHVLAFGAVRFLVEQAVWDLRYAEKYGTKSLYPEDLMTKEHFQWFFNPKNELWPMLDLDGEAICDRLRLAIAGLK